MQERAAHSTDVSAFGAPTTSLAKRSGLPHADSVVAHAQEYRIGQENSAAATRRTAAIAVSTSAPAAAPALAAATCRRPSSRCRRLTSEAMPVERGWSSVLMGVVLCAFRSALLVSNHPPRFCPRMCKEGIQAATRRTRVLAQRRAQPLLRLRAAALGRGEGALELPSVGARAAQRVQLSAQRVNLVLTVGARTAGVCGAGASPQARAAAAAPCEQLPGTVSPLCGWSAPAC